MIKICKDSKIYVQCPAGACTGGAELLHQIVSYLRDKGLDAYIVYFGEGEKSIPSDYSKYNIKIADAVSNSSRDVSVLYEPTFYQVSDGSNVQKLLWWLSVDNYYGTGSQIAIKDYYNFNHSLGIRMLIRRIGKLIIKGKNDFASSISLKKIASMDVVCGYQSEYAHKFLHDNEFLEMVPLKDYINTDHIKPFNKKDREDIVLYNPKKGFEYTRKLIEMSPDINWVPIINMTRAQVIELMQKAKVYVDFGNHPGKDRLPRECAMNGLCIITGMRGSARYFEDVWIDRKYKFDEKRADKKDIINVIRNLLKEYETAIDDFAFYRNKIQIEKEEFEEQLNQIFLK